MMGQEDWARLALLVAGGAYFAWRMSHLIAAKRYPWAVPYGFGVAVCLFELVRVFVVS